MQAEAATLDAGPAYYRRVACDVRRRGRRPGVRARRGRHPPGREAVEPDARPQGAAEAARLRPGADDRRLGRDDGDGRGPRHAGLHEPGAGAGQDRRDRPPHGRLLARRHALRDADASAALRGRRVRGGLPPDPHHRSRRAADAERADPEGPRDDRAQGDGEGAREPLRGRRGPGAGPPRLRRRPRHRGAPRWPPREGMAQGQATQGADALLALSCS